MSLQNAGLTDVGFGPGLTTNFQIEYESSLYDSLPAAQKAGVKANLINNANSLLAVVESNFNITTGWFNTPSGKFGTGNRQIVLLNRGDGSGANNTGYGNPINIDSQSKNTNVSNAAGIVGMVWMNEWVEILMSLTGGQWNAGDSNGEGLSQYSGIELFQNGHYNYYGSWVDQWLNQQPVQDWVTQTKGTDGDAISFGCALGFIFYLNTQLGFSINQIIAAYSSNLAKAYNVLTGDGGNPFPFFINLIQSVFPPSSTTSIPGPVSDNPFPIAQVSFWDDKNTFGKDEVNDSLHTAGGIWPNAFWLIVEGFSKQSFQSLNIAVSNFSGSFLSLPGVKIAPDAAGIDFENAANPQAPQRIRIPFDIQFTDPNVLNSFPGSGTQTYDLSVALNIGGTTVSGSSASTQFELLAGADPYFTNVDPAHNNFAYLSQDLRVFTGTPALNAVPVTGGPTLTDSVTGGFTYVQNLLTYLNNNFSNPNGTDPFNTVLPDQAAALSGDSSVTPVTLDLSQGIFNPRFLNNYNFAVARVRMRGTAGPAGAAKDVRVFFRLWGTQTADTDYDTTNTYPFTADASGNPGSPLVGSGHHTLPFFATGNFSGNTDYASGGPNIQTIQIPSGFDSVWRYYGCFLNLYDPNNKIDNKQIQAWLPGTHHCIVAQIAFDDAPIPAGASPESWDQLAQRNLQVTTSDNPGPASTHRVPQTFDIRPSGAIVPPGGGQTSYPDELMIDWGKIPVGSVASIYWPQVAASDVIALASKFYSTNSLAASDMNTIKVKITGGVSYIPIPAGAGENFAGLFTLDLPTTVVTGQEFNVLVRRIATVSVPPPVVIQTRTGPSNLEMEAKRPKSKLPPRGPQQNGPTVWRYVVGSFQVKIPVTTGDKMLRPEETTLAIMKWRLEQMSPSDRWYPVLERYIGYIAGRVDGLGGNSQGIPPSLTGIVPIVQTGETGEKSFSGKVCEVLFDCFGDFEGFVLCECCGSRKFKSRQRSLCEIALRACRDQLPVTVYVDPKCEDKIARIAIRQ